MLNKLKRGLSLLLCICFVFSFCVESVFAQSNNVSKIGQTKVVGNVTMEVVADDNKSITVKAVDASDVNQELFYTVDKKTKASTAEVKIYTDKKKDKNTFTSNKLDIKVDTINTSTGEVSMELTDKVTHQKFKVEKNKGESKDTKVKAQVVPLIVGALGLAAEWVAQQLLYITIATMVLLSVSQVIDDLNNNETYDHYAAYTIPGDDVYVGDPLNFSAAVARMAADEFGFDVISRNHILAYQVAYAAYPSGWPEGPEIGSGAGQYYHYHTYNRVMCTHSYYLQY